MIPSLLRSTTSVSLWFSGSGRARDAGPSRFLLLGGDKHASIYTGGRIFNSAIRCLGTDVGFPDKEESRQNLGSVGSNFYVSNDLCIYSRAGI